MRIESGTWWAGAISEDESWLVALSNDCIIAVMPIKSIETVAGPPDRRYQSKKDAVKLGRLAISLPFCGSSSGAEGSLVKLSF